MRRRWNRSGQSPVTKPGHESAANQMLGVIGRRAPKDSGEREPPHPLLKKPMRTEVVKLAGSTMAPQGGNYCSQLRFPFPKCP